MRGEETEIFGYVDGKTTNNDEILFMHYGSHHKCILYKDGKIIKSSTALTGELMMALFQYTILKNSLLPPGEIVIDMDWVQKGLEAAIDSGFGRALFSTRIINTMMEKQYTGLNVDFENVLPADRELYNQFMQRAADRMHKEGYFISSALAPKLSAEQQGLLYTAHDYPAHGKIADFVVLMTYEWGWRFGPPQAISPLNQIKRVLDYAVSVMPRNKIFFGFQLYARDWLLPHVKGQEAETFSMEEAMNRARRYTATIQYDTTTDSPYYRYTDDQGRGHEVWFEDARSAQAKFETVKSYNLRGVSYWALGYPFPENWVLLEDNFTVKK
jgi:spore germination protein